MYNQPFKKILTFQQSTSKDKKRSGLLDVTMAVYDVAEVCELLNSFLPFNFQVNIKKTSAYIKMMALQFSKKEVVHKWKE